MRRVTVQSTVFGNPHSANPSSSRTGERIDTVRDAVLRFFNADPAEYQVVWTTSATGALKIVGETFPWAPGAVFRCACFGFSAHAAC
jgi:molybdenum cofactor sulfurtransferase